MSEPGTEPDEHATAQQLGESFAALVGTQDWHVDEVPEAGDVGYELLDLGAECLHCTGVHNGLHTGAGESSWRALARRLGYAPPRGRDSISPRCWRRCAPDCGVVALMSSCRPIPTVSSPRCQS